ncbi:MAG: AbrB family transcriptional regulator, partial [Rhodobacteraceae bacterium]|nr:AbrB family transcriptional regulator [Paracoccaceae bacterium]
MFSVKLAHLILAFVCATAGAMLFTYLGVPAATLTGATAAVTLLALSGIDVSFSVPLRNATILVLGINIGAAVSPEAIQAAITWPLSLG